MIPLFKVFMSEDVIKPLNKVLLSGYITQGSQVEKFEQELGKFLNTKYVLTLNSATAGLTMALRLLKNKTASWIGVEDTDIILTPALTCFATTASILANNMNIRWLDVDENTSNICLKDLKQKLNNKTKVIYTVHWGGACLDFDELDKILDEHKKTYGFRPMIVEDCAHAFGAEYNNKKLGSNGNICVYSTQAIKHLTTGDGGIITLPNKELYERAKLLRWYGIDRDRRNYKKKDFRMEHDIMEYGYKFHMNDINATIGLYNLPHMKVLLEKNRINAKYYDDHLKNIEGIQLMKYNDKVKSAYWLYTIKVNNKQNFIEKMKEKKIMVSQVHNRNDIHTCVSMYKENLPNLDNFEKSMICIPVGWWLNNDDLKYIVNSIKQVLEN